jgi:hypothetical protein
LRLFDHAVQQLHVVEGRLLPPVSLQDPGDLYPQLLNKLRSLRKLQEGLGQEVRRSVDCHHGQDELQVSRVELRVSAFPLKPVQGVLELGNRLSAADGFLPRLLTFKDDRCDELLCPGAEFLDLPALGEDMIHQGTQPGRILAKHSGSAEGHDGVPFGDVQPLGITAELLAKKHMG